MSSGITFAENDSVIYECTVCGDTINDNGKLRFIASDVICFDCIRDEIVPQFQKAVENEFNYPVKWGPQVLSAENLASDLKRFLGRDFVDRYKQVGIEYSTPPKDRVYCKNLIEANRVPKKGAEYHGILSSHSDKQFKVKVYGPRQIPGYPPRTPQQTIDNLRKRGVQFVECGAMACAHRTQHYDDVSELPICWSCRGKIHPCCGEAAIAGAPKHVCKYVPPRPSADGFMADDMVRGKNYQICPSEKCRQVVQLADGCNHITCKCGTDFCFVCGEGPLEVHGEDAMHWSVGKPCPRYNKPGDENAWFDNQSDEEDDDGTDEEMDDIHLFFAILQNIEIVHGHLAQVFGRVSREARRRSNAPIRNSPLEDGLLLTRFRDEDPESEDPHPGEP